MSEWERVFLQNLAVPPHGQRRRARRPGSAAFRCVLKYLEGAALTQVGGSAVPRGAPGFCPPSFLGAAGTRWVRGTELAQVEVFETRSLVWGELAVNLLETQIGAASQSRVFLPANLS